MQTASTPAPLLGAEYSAGIGWQYVTHTHNGTLIGRYGSFNTEREALAAGRKALGLS